MAIPTNQDAGIFGDINITPLTDIFLVLLIIFMVGAAVAIESAAHVGLPQPKADPGQQPLPAVMVTLTSDRHIYIDRQEVGLNSLEPALQKVLEKSREKVVVFKGDPKVILGDMVIILDIANHAGARQLGVAVAENAPGGGTAVGGVPEIINPPDVH